MEISVIIPVRNRANLLIRTLNSIAGQTRLPDKLIIVDNGSTDNTVEKARNWASAHRDVPTELLVETKPGASAARNRGLSKVSLADGSFVMFFDSDDIMHPDHIARITKALENRPETDLLYFDIALRDPDGWTTVKSTPGENPLVRSHIFHSTLSTQRYVALASLVNRCGGWNDDLLRWNDYELGLRLAVTATSPLKLCGEPTVTVLPDENSITGTCYSKDAATLRKALDYMRRTLAAESRSQDLRYLHARRAILAALFAREGAGDEAEITLDEALEGAGSHDRAKVHLVYFVTRICGSGGAAVASVLLAPPRPKRPTRLNPKGK